MERIETITNIRELNISIIDDVIARYGFDAAKSAWQAIRSEIMEGVRERAPNSQSDAIVALRDCVEMIDRAAKGREGLFQSPIQRGKVNRAKDVLLHAHI